MQRIEHQSVAMIIISPRWCAILFFLMTRATDGTADFFPPLPEAATSIDSDTIDDVLCPLRCLNDATCARNPGDGPLNLDFELDRNSEWYCICPPGFYGQLCEKKAEQCGDNNYCYNGSKCLQVRLEDGYEHVCDCTAAYSDDQYWSGEFCQYPSTIFCTDPGESGRQFCTNGGVCPSNDHEPCICPTGFIGPRCAFEVGIDGSDYAECKLGCRNGGTCQKGQKDLESYGNFASDVSFLIRESHINFEHCECPTNYFGIRCEYEIEHCEDELVCLNGGSCTPKTRKCACPPGYGGEHCEFQQTLKNGYRNDGQSGAWLIVGCLFIVLGVMVAVALKSKPKAGDSIEPSFGSLGVEGITNPNEKKDENEWSSGSMQCFGSSFI